jgi:hypothetical protein
MSSLGRGGRICLALGVVLALLVGCGRPPEPVAQAVGQTVTTAGITVVYGPAAKPFNRVMRRLLLKSGRLEQLARIWRSSVPELKPVTIAVVECEQPDLGLARPGRIELCYDLLGYLDNAFRDLSGSPIERESGVLDGMSLWLTREMARNQDAPEFVKDSASLDRQMLALLRGGDGPAIAMAGIQWLYNQGKPEPMIMALPYWQANGFGVGQYDRLVCAIYRREPGRFPFLAAEYGREKVDRCGEKENKSVEESLN